MAQKRKPKKPPADAAVQTAASNGSPPAPAALTPDPPRPHFWFLIASGIALAGWLVFLLVIALRG